MVLGRVVGKVVLARYTIYIKLTLSGEVFKLVELHVNSFGRFLLDAPSDDAMGCVVISFHQGGRLRMAQFDQTLPNGQSLLGI